MLRQLLNLAEVAALGRIGVDKLAELLAEPVIVAGVQVRPRRSEGEKAAIRDLLGGFGGSAA